jgi:hypothetical protein
MGLLIGKFTILSGKYISEFQRPNVGKEIASITLATSTYIVLPGPLHTIKISNLLVPLAIFERFLFA